MKSQRLESLLREAVMGGSREPPSAECLGVTAVFRLLDAPGDAHANDLQHLITCHHCQQAVALAKRERDVVDAPWVEEAPGLEAAVGDMRLAEQHAQAVSKSRTIKLPRLPAGLFALSGIAAAVVVAVGVGWLSPDVRTPLGPVHRSVSDCRHHTRRGPS